MTTTKKSLKSKKVSKSSKKPLANVGKKTLGTDAKIIKAHVGAGGLSLRQMAQASGVSHTTVIQWGQGVCAPSDVTLKRLYKQKEMRGLVNALVAARVAAIGVSFADLRNAKAKVANAKPGASTRKAGATSRKAIHAKRSTKITPAGAKKTVAAAAAETLPVGA